MEIDDKTFGDMYDKLKEISANLQKVCDLTGTTDRVELMKLEIKQFGWEAVKRSYHPDNNTSDPARYPLYEMYCVVYDMMKRKGEI